jgi:hypothetical protein
MHLASSATVSSLRQASAQAVQVWAHSKQAAMQAASYALSMFPRSLGYVSSMVRKWVMALFSLIAVGVWLLWDPGPGSPGLHLPRWTVRSG